MWFSFEQSAVSQRSQRAAELFVKIFHLVEDGIPNTNSIFKWQKISLWPKINIYNFENPSVTIFHSYEAGIADTISNIHW